MSFYRKLKPLFDRPVFHLLLIALLGLIAYSNTFNAPFQWDDQGFIAENPIIKDLNYFLEPSKAKGLEYYDAFKNRYIGYLTFALNYKLHGLDVRGYHAVNIAIHLLNSFLVYFLVMLTFRTPFLKRGIAAPPARNDGQIERSLRPHSGGFAEAKWSNLIALFSALLFVSHPVQTEAVTYIFQRLASLAAFFYMLSLVLYIKWRLTSPPYNSPLARGGLRGVAFYLLSLLSAVLAMKTKENAFTLPIMIALYEFFFFEGKIKKRLLWLAPLFLTMLIIPLSFSGGIASAMKGYEGIPRMDYLFTQFRVIVTYIRLLVLPINQNVDYDYSIYQSLFALQVLFSFLFLMSLIGLGVYLSRRSKNKAEMRLISFGIFWFFITLSVESSVIPLPMVINEYRLYLPSVGVLWVITAGVFLLPGEGSQKRLKEILVLFFIAVSLLFSYASYKRNAVWQSEMLLWEDAVSKSPRKARSHYNLGEAYQREGFYGRAIEHYLIAVGLKPDYAEAHINLGLALAAQSFTNRALEHFHAALSSRPDIKGARFNLGVVYLGQGLYEKARHEFEAELEINPNDGEARRFLDFISNADLR